MDGRDDRYQRLAHPSADTRQYRQIAMRLRSASERTRRLVRSLLPIRKEVRRESGLRLVRGVPLVAAIEKDRVVREQLGQGHISLDAVRAAWYHMRDFEDPRPLWRILADVQGVDANRLFRSAAETYHFDSADVSMVGTTILIDGNRRQFVPEVWKRLIELGVFPIREKHDALDYGVRWIFASYDPARPIVRQYLSQQIGQAFQIRFLEPTTLFELIQSCFALEDVEAIQWYRHYVLARKPIQLVNVRRVDHLRRAA